MLCWLLTPVIRPSSPRKAVGMARGNINPLNQAVMDSYSPSKVRFPSTGTPLDFQGGYTNYSGPYDFQGVEVLLCLLSPSQAPPPKSKCWSGSVMGGDGGWGHSSRPPSSLLSSESSRNHFKPPKKLKPKSGTEHTHTHQLSPQAHICPYYIQ